MPTYLTPLGLTWTIALSQELILSGKGNHTRFPLWHRCQLRTVKSLRPCLEL